jgi:hypothetical protein
VLAFLRHLEVDRHNAYLHPCLRHKVLFYPTQSSVSPGARKKRVVV